MIIVKKIVPFNNVLTFDTDVSEISAISLEDDIKLGSDSISGIFNITGEYKITDGLLEKEPFKFELPFDIALGAPYKMDTVTVNIDDFRYELVGHKELKVNIDLAIDGDIYEENREETFEPEKVEIDESLDLLDEMLEEQRPEEEKSDDNLNVFDGFNEEEKYVTYRVYRVLPEDTVDKIIEKYHVTKEELAKYNDIAAIKAGDKLIIPAND